MVDESEPQDLHAAPTEVAPGIHAAYDLPSESKDLQPAEEVDTSMSLEELMAKMKSI